MRIDSDNYTKTTKIDVKDKKILDILSENSRMPISQIAKKIELSRDVTNYRINRFKQQQIIQKFYPKLNYLKLGYNTYHIFLLLDESKDKEQFIEELKQHPSIKFIYEFSDDWDIELVFIAKSVRELDEIITCIQAKHKDIIINRSELLEINTYNSILFSYYFNRNLENNKSTNNTTNNSSKNHKNDYIPDEIDMQILKELSQDARKSTYEMAKNIELGADAIGLRIKNLTNQGIIKKFSILPNLSKLGYNWHTFCIKMKSFDKDTEKRFRNFIENHPGIIRAAKTFGEWDIILYIISKNPKEFHNIIREIKLTFSDIIKSYTTLVAYKEHTFNTMPKILLEEKEEK